MDRVRSSAIRVTFRNQVMDAEMNPGAVVGRPGKRRSLPWRSRMRQCNATWKYRFVKAFFASPGLNAPGNAAGC
jgi:hypothetical protein